MKKEYINYKTALNLLLQGEKKRKIRNKGENQKKVYKFNNKNGK